MTRVKRVQTTRIACLVIYFLPYIYSKKKKKIKIYSEITEMNPTFRERQYFALIERFPVTRRANYTNVGTWASLPDKTHFPIIVKQKKKGLTFDVNHLQIYRWFT